MNKNAFVETCKVALYGATGSRKTLQIGNLIQAFSSSDIGIVSCERGLNTIRSLVNPDNVFPAESMDDFRNAYMWAKERFSGPEKWICVDGGTRVMQWNAGEIWSASDEVYTQLALGKKPNELERSLQPFMRFITNNKEIDGQRQWIQIGRDADRLLNAWKDLPCNLYWTFWDTLTSLDQYKKGLPWQVDAPGQASRDAIMGTFDFVFRLTYKDGKLVAQADPQSPVARAKVRDDHHAGIVVPKEMVDFNLASFVRLLKPMETSDAEAGKIPARSVA